MDGFDGTEGSPDTYGPSHATFDGAVDGDGRDDLDGTLDCEVNQMLHSMALLTVMAVTTWTVR